MQYNTKKMFLLHHFIVSAYLHFMLPQSSIVDYYISLHSMFIQVGKIKEKKENFEGDGLFCV